MRLTSPGEDETSGGEDETSRSADKREPSGPEDTLRGHRPGSLLAPSGWTLASFAAAGALWAAALARELAAGTAFDPAAVLLRLLALVATVRLTSHLSELVRRVTLNVAAPRFRLDLGPSALQLHRRDRTRTIGVSTLLGVTTARGWQEEGERFNPVYVLFAPAGGEEPPVLTIPPVFDHDPAALAERLMRWIGAPGPSPLRTAEDPLPSRRYETAAAAGHSEEAVVVPHGWAWLRRGPYTSVILGAALVDGWVRSGAFAGSWLPWTFLAVLVLIPSAWMFVTLRILNPRRGLSMVLEADGLLLRGPTGTISVSYQSLRQVSVERRWSWSVLEGLHTHRTLVLHRIGEAPVRYDEAFLGLPAAAAAALVDGLRQRHRPSQVGD